MVDLQEEFIAASQGDDRLHTFVVHLPTLGATEANVPAAMEVLNGPRVTHYWDGSGDLGHVYTGVLDIDPVYAWDVWMIYADGVMWESEIPPAPEEHCTLSDSTDAGSDSPFCVESPSVTESASVVVS